MLAPPVNCMGGGAIFYQIFRSVFETVIRKTIRRVSRLRLRSCLALTGKSHRGRLIGTLAMIGRKRSAPISINTAFSTGATGVIFREYWKSWITSLISGSTRFTSTRFSTRVPCTSMTASYHTSIVFRTDPQGDLATIAKEMRTRNVKWTAARQLFLDLLSKRTRAASCCIEESGTTPGATSSPSRNAAEPQKAATKMYVVNLRRCEDQADEFSYNGWWGHASLRFFQNREIARTCTRAQSVFSSDERWMAPDGKLKMESMVANRCGDERPAHSGPIGTVVSNESECLYDGRDLEERSGVGDERRFPCVDELHAFTIR